MAPRSVVMPPRRAELERTEFVGTEAREEEKSRRSNLVPQISGAEWNTGGGEKHESRI